MMLLKQEVSQTNLVKIFNMDTMNNLESELETVLIDIYIDKLKDGVWQGICKFKVEDDELAAVSVTTNLSGIFRDLFKKILIQMPGEVKVKSICRKLKSSYLN